MITCNLMGGLGNQIFQIFATISYAMKSKNQFKFINCETLGGGTTTVRHTFWNSFFHKLNTFLIDSYPQNLHIVRESNFKFKELPIYEMINRDVMIYGYFQSYKYFHNYYNVIYKLIGIKTMKDNLIAKMDYNVGFFNNAISLHFRIGDYKSLQHYHPIMTKEYYERSIRFILSKYNVSAINDKLSVLYFCEDIDIEDALVSINYLQEKFPNVEFIRGDNTLEDWEQMLLMSLCHHNIIANSSFSWWGAYFNDWTDKIVCYPSVWFGASVNHNTEDLYPSEWNKIKA